MAQVAKQSVAHVDGAAGNAAQRLAQGHARGGRFQALAGLGQDGGRQHVLALQRCQAHVAAAGEHAAQSDTALDLFAEELRLAHDALAEITGAFTSDDLLGEIFGRFCIGK